MVCFFFLRSRAENEELDESGRTVEDDDNDEEDQPLDLTVKRGESESSGAVHQRLPRTASSILENGKALIAEAAELMVSVSVKEANGIVHPKKRNWIKMEEEDDSFPHEIEEWKKTFAAGLCG